MVGRPKAAKAAPAAKPFALTSWVKQVRDLGSTATAGAVAGDVLSGFPLPEGLPASALDFITAARSIETGRCTATLGSGIEHDVMRVHVELQLKSRMQKLERLWQSYVDANDEDSAQKVKAWLEAAECWSTNTAAAIVIQRWYRKWKRRELREIQPDPSITSTNPSNTHHPAKPLPTNQDKRGFGSSAARPALKPAKPRVHSQVLESTTSPLAAMTGSNRDTAEGHATHGSSLPSPAPSLSSAASNSPMPRNSTDRLEQARPCNHLAGAAAAASGSNISGPGAQHGANYDKQGVDAVPTHPRRASALNLHDSFEMPGSPSMASVSSSPLSAADFPTKLLSNNDGMAPGSIMPHPGISRGSRVGMVAQDGQLTGSRKSEKGAASVQRPPKQSSNGQKLEPVTAFCPHEKGAGITAPEQLQHIPMLAGLGGASDTSACGSVLLESVLADTFAAASSISNKLHDTGELAERTAQEANSRVAHANGSESSSVPLHAGLASASTAHTTGGQYHIAAATSSSLSSDDSAKLTAHAAHDVPHQTQPQHPMQTSQAAGSQLLQHASTVPAPEITQPAPSPTLFGKHASASQLGRSEGWDQDRSSDNSGDITCTKAVRKAGKGKSKQSGSSRRNSQENRKGLLDRAKDFTNKLMFWKKPESPSASPRTSVDLTIADANEPATSQSDHLPTSTIISGSHPSPTMSPAAGQCVRIQHSCSPRSQDASETVLHDTTEAQPDAKPAVSTATLVQIESGRSSSASSSGTPRLQAAGNGIHAIYNSSLYSAAHLLQPTGTPSNQTPSSSAGPSRTSSISPYLGAAAHSMAGLVCGPGSDSQRDAHAARPDPRAQPSDMHTSRSHMPQTRHASTLASLHASTHTPALAPQLSLSSSSTSHHLRRPPQRLPSERVLLTGERATPGSSGPTSFDSLASTTLERMSTSSSISHTTTAHVRAERPAEVQTIAVEDLRGGSRFGPSRSSLCGDSEFGPAGLTVMSTRRSTEHPSHRATPDLNRNSRGMRGSLGGTEAVPGTPSRHEPAGKSLARLPSILASASPKSFTAGVTGHSGSLMVGNISNLDRGSSGSNRARSSIDFASNKPARAMDASPYPVASPSRSVRLTCGAAALNTEEMLTQVRSRGSLEVAPVSKMITRSRSSMDMAGANQLMPSASYRSMTPLVQSGTRSHSPAPHKSDGRLATITSKDGSSASWGAYLR